MSMYSFLDLFSMFDVIEEVQKHNSNISFERKSHKRSSKHRKATPDPALASSGDIPSENFKPSSRKTKKSKRAAAAVEAKSSKSTLTSVSTALEGSFEDLERQEVLNALMSLQVTSCPKPGAPVSTQKSSTKRNSKAKKWSGVTAVQAEQEKEWQATTHANKKRSNKSLKISESQLSVASTKSSQSSSCFPSSIHLSRAPVDVPSDVSIDNSTLRWEHACSDSDEESERIKQYKIGRRKRYLAASNKKYSDWLKTLEYEHHRTPSVGASGSTGSKMISGREIIVPSLIAKVTSLHSNTNHNHNRSPAILNCS